MSDKVEIIAELKDLISGKFADINKQIDAMDSKLSHIGSKGIGGGNGIMGQVIGANLFSGAISRAGSAFIDFGKDAFQAYGKSEQFLTSLTTMFHGNKQEAKALDQQLKGFAIETPFELTEIRDATKMMIAYGSTSGGVVDEMRMLGDISSGVGSSLSEVAYLYGTLRTQGRAFAKDIYQFTGRGIPIVKELAKQFKVTDSQVMKLVEDGKVGFDEIEKAMRSMTQEGGQFHDMMSAQSKTLLGQTSNLSDAWDQLKTSIGASQEGILKGTISWATGMVKNLGTFFDTQNQITNSLNAYGKREKNGDITNSFSSAQIMGSKIADLLNMIPGIKINSKVNETEMFAEGIQNNYVKGIKTPLQAANAEVALRNLLKHQYDAFDMREKSMRDGGGYLAHKFEKENGFKYGIDKQELDRNQAVIRGAIDQVKGIKDIFKSASIKNNQNNDNDRPKDLIESAKANKAVQVIVNIENLVREYVNNFVTPDQAKSYTLNDTLKALTTAVNNIYAVGQ